MNALAKLHSIASSGLAPAADLPPGLVRAAGALGSELRGMLHARNGFFAFELALHVLPVGPAESMDIETWNSAELWRDAYGELAAGKLFFAEDVFGGQFCVFENGVCLFDPETGSCRRIAGHLEEWAQLLLEDYEYLTGYPLARDWQIANGPLPVGKRLVPKQPFVLEGEFSVENLYPLDAVRSMKLRADLALQLRHLPDGSKVRYEIVD